jgi:hypothetical protein
MAGEELRNSEMRRNHVVRSVLAFCNKLSVRRSKFLFNIEWIIMAKEKLDIGTVVPL